MVIFIRFCNILDFQCLYSMGEHGDEYLKYKALQVVHFLGALTFAWLGLDQPLSKLLLGIYFLLSSLVLMQRDNYESFLCS